jgi:subtilisin family serine protease/putative cell wall-binding protein
MNLVHSVGGLLVTAAVVSSLVGVTTVPVVMTAAEPTSAFIVELAPGETALDVSSEVAEDLRTYIEIAETFDTLLNGFSAELTPSEIEALQASPEVLAVYPDLPVSINAPPQTDAPWNLSRLDEDRAPADSTYNYPASAGSGARIYVVDTGVAANSAQFGSRLLPGFDAISDGDGRTDCNGHGTHVAGTVASTTYGVAKQASIVPVRVFACDGTAFTSSVIAGLDWIAEDQPDGTPGIVNLSLGSADPVPVADDLLSTAVNKMSDLGFVMVVAAGNSTADACDYSPSRAAKTLTVAATTAADARASYSNFGACVDLFAPGSSIESLQRSDPLGSTVKSGTSMAAPHVAGVAALFLAESPSKTAREIEAQIIADAVLGWVSDVEEGSPNRLANVEPGAATAGGTFTSLPTPVISGTPQVGTQLSATTGSWAPAPVNLTLQWLRNGSPISGATGATYTPLPADAGSQLAARVTGENLPGFVAQRRTSTVTAAVLSGIPSAPLNLAATPAQRSATLSWTTPATSNGGTITDYVVRHRAGSTGSWVTFADGVGTGTRTTVTGLLVSTSYQFQVAAVTSFGTSPMASVSSTTPAAPRASSVRVAGDNRYSTSVSISQAAFPTANIGSGVPVLFVASGENFPDALSAGPVVSQLGGPVLLTHAATLPASVLAEIRRLRPATIAVIGGPGAVSATVFSQLRSLAPRAVRLGGANRYETSRLVTEYGFLRSGASVAYIAAGEGFADALAAGAAAGSKNAPIILVPGQAGSVDAATLTLLRNLRVTQIFVVGGEGAVSAGVANSLRGVAPGVSVVRLSGGDRLETAQAVNREAFGDAQRAYLAYAFNFPDALGGGVLATVRPGPLFTVPGDCVPAAVLSEIRRVGASEVVLLGGAGVLNARVAALTPCR